jgi:RNA polymerase sigma-70 factor (ECF subfamily)
VPASDDAPDGAPDGALDTAPDDGEDRGLLAAHVDGDSAAFGTLFGKHRDRLWAVALRTTGDPEEAADALQDAMVAAFRRADSFRGDAAVTTWLHRIVVNACLDRLRRRKVRTADPLPERPEEQQDRAMAALREREDPAARAEQAEVRRAVRAALDRLPLDQRLALVLVDVEGYSVAETAKMLGIAEGTVKSRCARGRGKLAKVLGHLRNPDAIANVPTHESKRAGRQPGSGEGR